ncbi:hypothetical protein [Streptosporangium lutulentum]|uniref:ANTAR domain-containing protein n=1 Tax=Streptosporangium lutulentum TaxID=1461250 RepID=A0ABT9Q6D8_9ACTN|nr:hypothetical protein [Streptosporangium lutulentum]MDP9842303.1 hypothetical protein [Streptosporangium lutulentum]
MTARDHELLHAAKRIAATLGFAPDEVMRRVVELGRGDRADWSSSELLLLALAQLAAERPISPQTGGHTEMVENIEAPRLRSSGRRPG